MTPFNDIEAIAGAINRITPGDDAATDALREVYDTCSALIARARECKATIECLVIEHIEATGQDIELNDGKRWYVGTKSTTRAVDDTQVLHAVLEASQGDIAKLTTGADGVLAAQPWKVAAVRALIGAERASELFHTTTEQDLKTGKALKALKTADARFTQHLTQGD